MGMMMMIMMMFDEQMETVDLNADDDDNGNSVKREDLQKIIKIMSGLEKEMNDLKRANESISDLQQKIYEEIKNMNAKNVIDDDEKNKVNVDEELEKCDKE